MTETSIFPFCRHFPLAALGAVAALLCAPSPAAVVPRGYPAGLETVPLRLSQPLPGPAHDREPRVHAREIRATLLDEAFAADLPSAGGVRFHFEGAGRSGWLTGRRRMDDEGRTMFLFDLGNLASARTEIGTEYAAWLEFRGSRGGVSEPFSVRCGGPNELAECRLCWTLEAEGADDPLDAGRASSSGSPGGRSSPTFESFDFSPLAEAAGRPETAKLDNFARKLCDTLVGKQRAEEEARGKLDEQLRGALRRGMDAARAKGDLDTVLLFEAAIQDPSSIRDPKDPTLASLLSKRAELLADRSRAAAADALQTLGSAHRALDRMKSDETRAGSLDVAKEVQRYQERVAAMAERLRPLAGAAAPAGSEAHKAGAGAPPKNWRVRMECKHSGTVASGGAYTKTSSKSFDVSLRNSSEEEFSGELVWHFIGKGRSERDSRVLETRRETVKIAPGKSFEKTLTSGTYSGYSYSSGYYSYSDSSAKLVQGAVVQLVKDGRAIQSWASMPQWVEPAKTVPFKLP